MGKGKTRDTKIEDQPALRSTFNKRCLGLIKKAYELGVLCQVDVALLVLAPSGKLIPFSMNSRF
jgi:SRF-type transcription factor (DNA-binding and dimerisation domain)